MKRGRNTSLGARTLSLATAQGIISSDQKQWLKTVLAEGDRVVEDALETWLSSGNSQPLRELVESGKNGALRARLATLSSDRSAFGLDFSSDLDFLVDLGERMSSVSVSGNVLIVRQCHQFPHA